MNSEEMKTKEIVILFKPNDIVEDLDAQAARVFLT